jgi:hypothetical protein
VALAVCLVGPVWGRVLFHASPSALDMAKALVDTKSFSLVLSEPLSYTGPRTAKIVQTWAPSDSFEAELYPHGALKLASSADGSVQDAVLKFTVKAKVGCAVDSMTPG